MTTGTFRRRVILILVLSLGLRLGFLMFGDLLPVMWDARRYVAASIGLISLVDDSGAGPVVSEREDRLQFDHYCRKYIQGEQIEWLFYQPHTLTQAREDMFFSGPLYPGLLAVILLLAPTEDFTFARLLGVLLDALSTLLIIGIGLRLVGRKAALIASLLYAIYFPFMLGSSMLLLETSTSFWILLALYLLLRGCESHDRWPLMLAGVVTGLLVLNKPTAMLLMIPLSIGLLARTHGVWPARMAVSRWLFYVTPAVLIFVAWLVLTSTHYGQLTLRDPSYAASNLRQSSSIVFEGYDLDKVEKDFWKRSVVGDLVSDPIGTVGLTVKKFDRLWHRPFNDFKRSFIVPYRTGEKLHLVIVVSGLLGLLILASSNLTRAVWPVAIIGYYTAVHLIFHSLSRYNFNAMPMVLLGSAYLMTLLWEACQTGTVRTRLMPVAALVLMVAAYGFDQNWLNSIFGNGMSLTLVIGILLMKTSLLGGGLFLLSRRLTWEHYPRGRLLVVAVPLLLVSVIGWTTTLSRAGWAEFECRLTSDSVKAGTRLYISDLKEVRQDELLAVVVDVNSGHGRRNTFTMAVGDTTFEFVGGQKPLSDLFYPKATYDFYARFEPLGIEQFRQYAIVPLDDSLIRRVLDRDGFVDIWLAINDRFEEENNHISVWGNYKTGSRLGYIPGVRFTSIERYVHCNDPRIRYQVNYLSDSTLSCYTERSDGKMVAGRDLSPAAGKQTGRYNIFLMHFKPDGSCLVY
ncbi:MAG: glycosyltransferase family 39 protein [bacterium]